MVIIMRFINSLASTSFTRTSSFSARSFTVIPSASVMVRVIGGGAAGIIGGGGATGRSRRAGSAAVPAAAAATGGLGGAYAGRVPGTPPGRAC